MSAITETEPDGEMVCIVDFSARPSDSKNQPIPGGRRAFRVGEKVRFITYFYKTTPEDNPTGYMAVFKPLDPKDENRYAATQTYFVSLDCWEGLKRHFASKLMVVERDMIVERPEEGAYILVEAKTEAHPPTERKSVRRR